MEVIVSCCAGLDVHKDSVEAYVRRLEDTEEHGGRSILLVLRCVSFR